MSKRSNGEGTIYKRKDGRWCASKHVILADGVSKRKTVYGKTQKEVKEKLKQLEDEVFPAEAGKMLLQDWMLLWMKKYKKMQLKQTTYENYEMNINTHIKGTEIGTTRLVDLTTGALQEFYIGKLKGEHGDRKISRRTVEYLHTIIGSALTQAYKNGLVLKNVNDSTVLPKKEQTEITPLTVGEVKKVLEVSKTSDIHALLVVAIYTGMRKGEILGLKWEDIDFNNKVIHVKRSLCRVKNDDPEDSRKTKLVLMKPKTVKSVRTIPLSKEAEYALRRHHIKQNEQKMKYRNIYQDQGLVFTREDGTFADARGVIRKFQKILDEAGVKRCRFHDLRHTFASILLNNGESMKVIQELLGHSTITTTMDIYSHVTEETKERSVELLEQLVKTS